MDGRVGNRGEEKAFLLVYDVTKQREAGRKKAKYIYNKDISLPWLKGIICMLGKVECVQI